MTKIKVFSDIKCLILIIEKATLNLIFFTPKDAFIDNQLCPALLDTCSGNIYYNLILWGVSNKIITITYCKPALACISVMMCGWKMCLWVSGHRQSPSILAQARRFSFSAPKRWYGNHPQYLARIRWLRPCSPISLAKPPVSLLLSSPRYRRDLSWEKSRMRCESKTGDVFMKWKTTWFGHAKGGCHWAHRTLIRPTKPPVGSTSSLDIKTDRQLKFLNREHRHCSKCIHTLWASEGSHQHSLKYFCY